MGGFLNLLGMYGPGATSQGQPVGQGSPQDQFTPQPSSMPQSSSDPAEKIGGEKTALWKQLLPGLIGALGSGLLAGKEGAGAFAANYASAKHQQNQQKREQEHQTQKAIADQAHKSWQELQNQDWSSLPPELSHLSGKAQELNQKYVAAIAKDSPGGITISPKEAQEIIAISSVLRGAKEKVGAFQQQEQKLDIAASPYTSAIRGGSMEPPPGAEQIAELGLPDSEASRLAGREAYSGAELARQQYDTPREIPGFGMGTPKDELAIRSQDMRAQAEKLRLIASDERQDKAIRARAEQTANQIEASFSRLGMQLGDRQKRHEDMPIPVQTTDADGNPVTQFVRRGDVEAQLQSNGGKPVAFDKALPAAERAKAKEASFIIASIRDLQQMYKPEYVGPIGGPAYRDISENTPESLSGFLPGSIKQDPMRSAFVAQSADLSNRYVKLITGAQVGQTEEAKRLLSALPRDSDPPLVYKAKLDRSVRSAEVLYGIQSGKLSPEQGLEQIRGILAEAPTAPGLPPPPKPAPATLKPKSNPLGLDF